MTYPNFFHMLSDEIRWQLLIALSDTDLRVQELVDRVGRPQNAVSYHLHQLQEQGLVWEQRSIADGRGIYYSLDLDRLGELYRMAGTVLHPSLGTSIQNPPDKFVFQHPLQILFLCTQNSARSQMAEGILRSRVSGPVEINSAGSQPAGIHPLAIKATAEMDIDISQQRSKHFDEFLGRTFDYVITVCDRVREVCPVFPGDPYQIHWSIPDPASIGGDETTRFNAFRATAEQLNRRIGFFLSAIHKI
jgi:protein-tyrosine-phosphatase/DNA-binding transcriptional ArsR family regulator